MTTAAAARKRKYRERRAIGAIVVAVEVDQEAIDALVDLGEIAPVQREDRHAIAEAIGDLVQRIVAERCSSASKREH